MVDDSNKLIMRKIVFFKHKWRSRGDQDRNIDNVKYADAGREEDNTWQLPLNTYPRTSTYFPFH